MLEWLKRHAWKACIRQKRIPSSNLGLSARKRPTDICKAFLFFRASKNVTIGVVSSSELHSTVDNLFYLLNKGFHFEDTRLNVFLCPVYEIVIVSGMAHVLKPSK